MRKIVQRVYYPSFGCLVEAVTLRSKTVISVHVRPICGNVAIAELRRLIYI